MPHLEWTLSYGFRGHLPQPLLRDGRAEQKGHSERSLLASPGRPKSVLSLLCVWYISSLDRVSAEIQETPGWLLRLPTLPAARLLPPTHLPELPSYPTATATGRKLIGRPGASCSGLHTTRLHLAVETKRFQCPL